MQFARSRLLRIFLRLLLVAGGAFLALVLVVTVFYEAEVKQKIISELNRHLRSEIKVSDFDISLLRHFPFASFEMKEVTAMDAVAGKESDTLLRAERISCSSTWPVCYVKTLSSAASPPTTDSSGFG